jgi:hypothetical protein
MQLSRRDFHRDSAAIHHVDPSRKSGDWTPRNTVFADGWTSAVAASGGELVVI